MPNSFAFFVAPLLCVSVAVCYLVFNSYFNQPISLEDRPPRNPRRRRVYKYIQNEHESTCRICLESYVSGEMVARLQCLCLYHENCIDRWFMESASCPVHTHIW